ncbi:biotin transport system substrate-specific component [Olsenella profusa DSM 13989]|uniref:biotin transporter BioY n=1 Tax=Olsenella profusa TaxID=138595 RepID=UPI002783593F|nr:biotin transporter BioY [Olsenella profusa]MDP9860652.1 biotin transport system substrate-specific component [Olsenella profusa DSM 13989]
MNTHESNLFSDISLRGARPIIKTVLCVTAAALLLCLSASVEIPLQPVPFTLQVLALGIIAATFDPGEAVASVLVYIAIGALGAPVFSGAMGGLLRLVGPTGGFIVGFVPGVAVGSFVRKLLIRHRMPRPIATFLALGAMMVIIYLLGWGQLALVAHLSPTAAFAAGVAPFVTLDMLKAVIATSVACAIDAAATAR